MGTKVYTEFIFRVGNEGNGTDMCSAQMDAVLLRALHTSINPGIDHAREKTKQK